MLELLTLENGVALLTLTVLEIVLGIDNIVFIAIVAGKLGPENRDKARIIGLSLAIVSRLMLLFTLSFIATLTAPIFSVLGQPFSGRDLILIGGGVFLMWKATKEISAKSTGDADALDLAEMEKTPSLKAVIAQIILIDIIFSLDSVITAVGMSNNIPVMGTAVVAAIVVMLIFSKKIVEVIELHPTIKMLALSFLLMIGLVLVADGFGHHIQKGYIYFAMGFSLFVEMMNIRSRRTSV